MTVVFGAIQKCLPGAPRLARRLSAACLLVAPLLLSIPAMGQASRDRDGDGVLDTLDNCPDHENTSQRDTDRDGFGNRCDPDFNNDGIVDSVDRTLMTESFVFEPHGGSDSHVREGEPPECGETCGAGESGPACSEGVWSRADRERARDFDLDENGVVDARDLRILNSFQGKAPGPLDDSDGDGALDGRDLCPEAPERGVPLLAGCTALDVAQRPERLVDPVVGFVEDLREFVAEAPELAAVREQLGLAVESLNRASRSVRAGDPCGAAGPMSAAEEHFASAGLELEALNELARDAVGRVTPGDDVSAEELVLLDFEFFAHEATRARDTAAIVRGAFREICEHGQPVAGRAAVVARVSDGDRRVQFEDGASFAFAEPLRAEGGLAEGVEVAVSGLDFGDGTGIVTEWIGPAQPGPPPGAMPCIRPLFAPVQRMAPLFPGPYLTHDPAGYLVDGEYQVEEGMRITATHPLLCSPKEGERFSLEVRITYTTETGQVIADHPLAADLDALDVPVPLPLDIEPHSLAQLAVNARKQSCGPVGGNLQICSVPEVFATSELALRVRQRWAYCGVSYERTLLDVDDQLLSAQGQQTDFRTTHVTGGFPFPPFLGEFAAEAYAANGFGAVVPIGIGDPFAVFSHDFFPVYVKAQLTGGKTGVAPPGPLNLEGAAQEQNALLETGVPHPAGVMWPHRRGLNNGHEFQFSCAVPKIVRDVVNFCPDRPVDAYYRMPFLAENFKKSFPEEDRAWTQSLGNFDGTHDGFAYDMGASCGTTIRAPRAGVVVFINDGSSTEWGKSCDDGMADCPNHTCCAPNLPLNPDCRANSISLRHQDGHFTSYLHLSNGSVSHQLGDIVRRGEGIAAIGATGNAGGPHVHWKEFKDWICDTANKCSVTDVLMLFEALNPAPEPGDLDDQLLRCYEPKNGDPLLSNNLPWPR